MYCQCGCGQTTTIIRYGSKAGQPRTFISGHNGRLPIEQMFWKRVQKTEDCWLWIGVKSKHGYGRLKIRGPYKWAHRASWLLNRGPIPEGMCVLHKCDNPPCIKPDHLQLGKRWRRTL